MSNRLENSAHSWLAELTEADFLKVWARHGTRRLVDRPDRHYGPLYTKAQLRKSFQLWKDHEFDATEAVRTAYLYAEELAQWVRHYNGIEDVSGTVRYQRRLHRHWTAVYDVLRSTKAWLGHNPEWFRQYVEARRARQERMMEAMREAATTVERVDDRIDPRQRAPGEDFSSWVRSWVNAGSPAVTFGSANGTHHTITISMPPAYLEAYELHREWVDHDDERDNLSDLPDE